MKTIEKNPVLKLNFYSDAGHGWLRVPRKNISFDILKQISGYSYQSRAGNMIYLEEDCDCNLFINDYGQDRLLITDINAGDYSPIRYLEPFNLNRNIRFK